MSAEALTLRYSVDPAHPALAGHFPGNPIVPAAMLLRFVALTLEHAGHVLTTIERIKFLRPVRPGEQIEVTVAPIDDTRGSIEMMVDGGTVARGAWHSSRI